MEQAIVQRNWHQYNAAQTSEKLLAMKLICNAIDRLQIPYEYAGNGRPHISTDDMIKACCIKVFNNFSTRRTTCELQLAKALGYIERVPHFNSISNYMRNEEITQYLHKIYKILALPLTDIESTFAVDATGFTTFKKRHWVEYRLSHKLMGDWKKLHITTGVVSGIIAAARVTNSNEHDSIHFDHLVRKSSETFKMLEVCADAGYLSRMNCQLIEELGGKPFIMPKSNTKLTRIRCFRDGTAWNKMIKLWRDHKEEFLQHYHKRSNVESTFSSMKRKFLPYIRSKDDVSQENELLCKVICHNASVLCNAMFELKVDLNFEEME